MQRGGKFGLKFFISHKERREKMKKQCLRELRSSTHITSITILATLILVIMLLISCGYQKATSEERKNIVVEFKHPIKASELFLLLTETNRPNQAVRVFVSYGETKASWLVPANNAVGQLEWLVQKSVERLTFLRSNFKKEDALEGRVHNELTVALRNLQTSRDVNVEKILLKNGITEQISSHRLIGKIYSEIEKPIKPKKDKHNSIGSIEQAIYDWPGDAGHVPVAGTSTFYSDGILHKFWLDSSAVSYYNSYYSMAYQNGNKAPALEIDSLFKSSQSGADVVSCGYDAFSEVSNLPYNYVDTELFDNGQWRNCSVGSHLIPNLQTWYLYWTWRSLDNLKINENPKMRLALQPSEKCSWCNDVQYIVYKAACTCAVGYPNSPSSILNNDNEPWYQVVVDYYYNEAPGQEVSWYRY